MSSKSLDKRKWFESTFDRVAIPLLLFMTFWVFINPASYWVGWWPGYEERAALMGSQPFMAVPPDILSKYANLTDVKLTHILPSGVWSICGALQLNSWVRISMPGLHRLSGRLLFLCSALIMAGYVLMELHGSTDPGWSSPAANPPSQHGYSEGAGEPIPAGAVGLGLVSAWFVFTAWRAWQLARGRSYGAHSRWAVRHMAAGMWVIVQRLIVGTVSGVAQVAKIEWTQAQKQHMFAAASATAIVVTISATEVWLRGRRGGNGALSMGTTATGAEGGSVKSPAAKEA